MARGCNRHTLPVSFNEPERQRNQRNRREIPGLSRIQTTEDGFVRERMFLPSDTASTSEHAMLLHHDEPENYGSVNFEIVDSDSQLSSLPQYSECARDMPPEYSSGTRRVLRRSFAGFRSWWGRRAFNEADLESAITIEEQFVNARLLKTSPSSPRYRRALQSLRRHRSRYPHAWSEDIFMSESEVDTRRAIAFIMGFALLMTVLALMVSGVVYFGGPYGV
ncbi:hypothetical protein AC579_9754 [Pseudocercospora musae]|uniref:Uncharacterized protein n=1 Tax=Pseudocercospora musae TaxID=113226 RepID=A0A139I5Y1_9PEZI|nr:hypothetical protein AC579_9754 [Pseudocercospora musae]